MKDLDLLGFELWVQNYSKEVADEAQKIAKDYPELSIMEVIAKAKEYIDGENK